ncbi:sensor histidine kinase [Corallococcus sicarius]|nr:PAS domain S-box protein [Corallococcus sicarius]
MRIPVPISRLLDPHPAGASRRGLRQQLGRVLGGRVQATRAATVKLGWSLAMGAVLLGLWLGAYGPAVSVTLFMLLTLVGFLAVTRLNANALLLLEAKHRQVEQSLRLSEARFSGIVSHAADAIISIDHAQRIILFNASAERIFGYAASEVLGQPLDVLLPERFRAVHARHVRQFLEGSASSRQMGERLPISGRRKGGEEFLAEASISKLDVEGTQLLTVSLRDISARKWSEDVLRNSEERFRTAFEYAPIGMALVGLDGRFLTVNASLCDIVGYSREELLARSFQDLTVAEDLEKDLLNARRLRSGDIDTVQREKHYRHRDGHILNIQLTASSVRDAHGEPVHFIAQMQDITERKQLEQAWRFLAEAGPRLAASLEPQVTLTTVAALAVPALADWCAVHCLEDDGRTHRVESAAATPELARSVRELIATSADHPPRTGGFTASVLRTGKPLLIPEVPPEMLEAAASDAEHLALLRRLAPESCIIVPLKTPARILGAAILVTSGSGRRYGARDLAQAEELASRAAIAIDNAQLHAKSEQATRIRDEVLRIVAHDLRAPLNVIALSAGKLGKGLSATRAVQKPLESIRKAVERANRLIQDLLDVARMEGGTLSVEREPMEVAPLVRDVVELHRALVDAKSLQIGAFVPEDVPPILADRERVLQILSNLLGNALKFTPEGGSITLRVQPEKGQMRFCVGDTGPGIPAEDLPHLFDPFWQSREKRKEGAGLGLAIVKGLVEAHGGQLGVDSRPGEGSTFFFTLPTGPPGPPGP